MSLNGLDDAKIKEAFEAASSKLDGWLLLHYASRDEIELFDRGDGGFLELHASIAKYEDASPLYGFLKYRDRNVIVKYLPENCSRLIQARVAVHFDYVCESFGSYDATLSVSSANEVKDSALAIACSLQPASLSPSPSISSLRRRRLAEIVEEDEEEEQRVKKRRSTGDEAIPEVHTPVSGSLAESARDRPSPEDSNPFDHNPWPSSPAPSIDKRSFKSTGYSGYSTFPKTITKVAPRPSVDPNLRNHATTNQDRPVSTMPLGVKLSSRGSKRGKVNDQNDARSISEETEPALSSRDEEHSRVLDYVTLARPVTSDGASAPSPGDSRASIRSSRTLKLPSSPSKQPAMSPEMARLLKAKKLREKKKKLSLPQSDESSVDPNGMGLINQDPSPPTSSTEQQISQQLDQDAGGPASLGAGACQGLADSFTGGILHGRGGASHEPSMPVRGSIGISGSDTIDVRALGGQLNLADNTYAIPVHTDVDDYPETTLEVTLSPETRAMSVEIDVHLHPELVQESAGVHVGGMDEPSTIDTASVMPCDTQMAPHERLKPDDAEPRIILGRNLALSSRANVTESVVTARKMDIKEATTTRSAETKGDAALGPVADPVAAEPRSEASQSTGPIPAERPMLNYALPEESSAEGMVVNRAKIVAASETDGAEHIDAEDNQSSKRKAMLITRPTEVAMANGEGVSQYPGVYVMVNGATVTEAQNQIRVEPQSDDTSRTSLPSSQLRTTPISSSSSEISRAKRPGACAEGEIGVSRASSNPTWSNLLHAKDTLSSPRSVSSSGPFSFNKDTQNSSANRSRRPNVGLSISQRIKALQQSTESTSTPLKDRVTATYVPVRASTSRHGDTAASQSMARLSRPVTPGIVPSPPRSRDSVTEDSMGLRREASVLKARLSQFEGGNLPRGRPESIQVTTRVVHRSNPPHAKTQSIGEAAGLRPASLELEQSPLFVNVQQAHVEPIPTPVIPPVMTELSAREGAKRLSILHRPTTAKERKARSPNLASDVAEAASTTTTAKMEGKAGTSSRRSSLSAVRDFIFPDRSGLASPTALQRPPSSSSAMLRMSPELKSPPFRRGSPMSEVSGSGGALSPISSESDDGAMGSRSHNGSGKRGWLKSLFPTSVRKNSSHGLAPSVPEEEAVEETTATPMVSSKSDAGNSSTVTSFLGDVNVQLPDNLLWKRRTMCLDSQGYLIIFLSDGISVAVAAAELKSPVHGSTRYHMSEFRNPYVPDLDIQEMAYSVVLDFNNGSRLQIAREDRQRQMEVLRIVEAAHKRHTSSR